LTPQDPGQAVELPPDYFTVDNLAHAVVWNLRTRHGKLDLTVTPSGFPKGYDQLVGAASPRRVAATRVEVLVASLADVEHSKRTADRDKDRRYLQAVGRLDAPDDDPGLAESAARSAPANESALWIAAELVRARARRAELIAQLSAIPPGSRARHDRIRAAAYQRSLEQVDAEIGRIEATNAFDG
jgi:hypothetical protein